MVIAVFLMGAPIVAAAAIPSLPAIVVLTALSGAGEAALVVVYVSVRAANSPDALVGRIASTARVMALGLMPIGSLVGGILIDAIGGTETLAILGASICFLALVFSQVDALRSASLAPSGQPPRVEPMLPIPDGLEQ
jgi:MFS family permease